MKDIFVDDFDPKDDVFRTASEMQAMLERERQDRWITIRNNLYFYSFVVVILAIIAGGITLVSRIIIYPFAKKFAEDWDD